MAQILEERTVEKVKRKVEEIKEESGFFRLGEKILSPVLSCLGRMERLKHRSLTFHDICPIWDNRINNWEHISMIAKIEYVNTLNNESPKCFLGEAWGWTGAWGEIIKSKDDDGNINFVSMCEQCNQFGTISGVNSLVRLVHVGGISPKFEAMKNEFVAHWNECHILK